MDYTNLLTTISNTLVAISNTFVDFLKIMYNADTNTGISQKLDQIITIMTNNAALQAQASQTASTAVTPADYTTLLNTLIETQNTMLARLDFLQMASLWVIGISVSSIVLYIIYRLLANFIEF
ncbi:MAG TPA: hypothetical protein VIK86_02135 [Candidatus Paceibacterota bacterium]